MRFRIQPPWIVLGYLALSLLLFHSCMHSDSTARASTAELLQKKARTLLALDSLHLAQEAFEKASQFYWQEENYEQYLICQNQGAYIFYLLEEFELAKASYEKLLQKIKPKLKEEHPKLVDTYYNLGRIYANQNNFKQGNTYLHQALQVDKQYALKDTLRRVNLLYHLAFAYSYQLDYKNALYFYQEIISVDEKVPFIHEIYSNIGAIHSELGAHHQALQNHQKSLNIVTAQAKPDSLILANCYNNIGATYSDLKEHQASLQYHQKALKIRQQLQDDQAIGATFMNIGITYDNLNVSDSAKFSYYQAIEKLQQPESHYILADAYNNLGLTFAALNARDSSAYCFQQSLALHRKISGNQSQRVALLQYNLGKLYKDIHPQLALQYFQKSLMANVSGFTQIEVYKDPPLKNYLHALTLLKGIHGKAQAFKKLWKNSSEARYYQLALNNYELCDTLIYRIRQAFFNKKDKIDFSEKAQIIYEEAIDLTIQQEDIAKAFSFSERSKAGILQELIHESQAKLNSKIPQALRDQEKNLKNEIAYYQSNLEYVPENEQSFYLDKLLDLQNALAKLIQQFELNYPKYYQLKYDRQITSISQIQARLSPQIALVSYSIGRKNLYIYHISREEYSVIPINITEEKLSHGIDRFIHALEGFQRDTLIAYSQALHNLLIKPIRSQLKSAQELLVIPDGILHRIPFEILLMDAPPSPQKNKYHTWPYLLKKYALSYYPSASLAFQNPDRARDYQHEFVGFAPVFEDGQTLINFPLASQKQTIDSKSPRPSLSALPKSAWALQKISQLFSPKKSFLYEQAVEDRLTASNLNTRLLHVASHGLIDSEAPIRSSIVFYPPDSSVFFQSMQDRLPSVEDGLLSFEEIFMLPLEADLVVLSVCDAGLGRLVKGEGVLSLSRGFMYAGAANLVLSLMKVDVNSTAHLMIQFYKHVAQGKSYKNALRQAKLDILNNPQQKIYHHPWYWGGFVLIGD